jgi:hypothetical protein
MIRRPCLSMIVLLCLTPAVARAQLVVLDPGNLVRPF